MLTKRTTIFIAIICCVTAGVVFMLIPYDRWTGFAAGVICGAAVAVGNYALTGAAVTAGARSGRRGIAYILPFARMAIYAAAFFLMVALAGFWAGVGCAAGCLSGPVAVVLAWALSPREKREYVYEEHIRSAGGEIRYVFMRGARYETYAGGRSFVTHSRFRKLKEIRNG
jgi:hypothetical protein